MPGPETLLTHRFGLGLRAGRIDPREPAEQPGRAGGIARTFPVPDTAACLAQLERWRQDIRRHEAGSKAARTARRAVQTEANSLAFRNARAELARAVETGDGYAERLVRFWSDHFTVRARRQEHRPLVTAFSDDAIRPNVAAPFAQMLRAATLHPAMLGFLDQVASVGPDSAVGQRRGRGLNENLARELLELHSLGVGAAYTQTDVRQTALLLTGLAVDGARGTVFDPRRAQPGAEQILGRRYGTGKAPRMEDILTLLDDLAAHPETARHICRKLAVHFVSDTPDPGLVEDLTAVWHQSDGDLARVSAALPLHPAALGRQPEKARQPFDFIVAALRALDVSGAEIMAWDDRTLRRIALAPMARMGQPWQTPGGPDGWEEDAAYWITPPALATRIDWAMKMPARLRPELPDARRFVDLALGDLADETLRGLVARAERKSEGLGLVLASPIFNRR